MNVTDLIQLVTVVITFTALAFTVHSFKQQIKQLFFTDYTKRYQEIMLHMPEGFFTDSVTYEKLDNQSKAYLRAYFDLCSEEFYLKSTGKIDKDVWENWEQGIDFVFKKKIVLEAWNHFNKVNYKDFSEWINKKNSIS